MESVSLRLSTPMLAVLRQMAAEQDVTIGQVIRDMLALEITRHRKAKTPVRADERLVAPLRALLAEDFAQATGWSDLQARLSGKGYVLVEAGGGLALHRASDGLRLSKGSELGYAYAQLLRRFQAPFPNHAHIWLADRVLNENRPSA